MDEENRNEEQKEESANGISADLIRGHINTIILRTLYERDKYGYEIIEEINEKSHGQYTLKQPTLYSALKRLESQGYINAYWKTDEVSQGGRRKYYTLTESGKEITEKNQAEWEYSRTVIDNLISDKNFDFTQPPPTPVDFKILKSTTSRVPIIKHEVSETSENQLQSSEEKKDAITDITTETKQNPEEKSENNIIAQPETSPADRERIHNNYLKLISEPVTNTSEPAKTAYSDNLDTDKLIYNNKPEPERDYKNLVNSLFDRTIAQHTATVREEKREIRSQERISVRYEEAAEKARQDGLTVNTADAPAQSRNKKYNRGNAMFKSSLIIAVIMLLEFVIALVFRNELGIGIAYPIVILALGCAQAMIFGVLCFTDLGKSIRKPATLNYIWSAIIITIILILIILVTSFLLGINFLDAGDVFAKFVFPSLISLNIPLFAVLFAIFRK